MQKIDDVLSCGDGGFVELRGGPAGHEALQISARELPLDGLGHLLVVTGTRPEIGPVEPTLAGLPAS